MANKAKQAKEGPDDMHRDTTGRIGKRHGNTRTGSLRKTYGEHFARGRRRDMMLKTLTRIPQKWTPVLRPRMRAVLQKGRSEHKRSGQRRGTVHHAKAGRRHEPERSA